MKIQAEQDKENSHAAMIDNELEFRRIEERRGAAFNWNIEAPWPPHYRF